MNSQTTSRFSLPLLASLGLSVLALASMNGCGSASDPISSLGSNANPSLGFPAATVSLNSPFTSGAPYFGLGVTSTSILAPGLSLVVDVTTTSVTLRHSSRITSVISGMSTVSARPGDYVAQGASLGTTIASVQWQILESGTPVCPLSYLSSSARTVIAGGANPCGT